MWDDKGGQELIHASDVVQSLKAKPKGLCSRFAVTLAAQEAAKFGRQADGLTQGGRLVGENRFSCPIGEKTFPFMFFKENSAGYIRRFPAELCQMVDAPSHYHINGQTGLYALGCPQLSLFNLAAALEGFMINLDCPPTGIPLNLFNGI